MRYVLGSRASIGGVLGSGRGGAAALWYLAGGVSAANCVAAYQPKGAASLAASYTNLANPGMYNASPGAAPTFDMATGWTFAAASSQYLTTGITPTNDQTWSAIGRFSNVSGTSYGDVIGYFTYVGGSRAFTLRPVHTTNVTLFGNGGELQYSTASLTSGVMAFAGSAAYINGSSVGTIPAAAGTFGEVHIGRTNGPAPIIRYFNGKIQAVAIYNTTLTAPQVAAISSAMSAL